MGAQIAGLGDQDTNILKHTTRRKEGRPLLEKKRKRQGHSTLTAEIVFEDHYDVKVQC